MAKIQNLFGRIQGNQSFYESELLRKVLQTLRGKDFTEASVLRVRPEVILSLDCHTTGNEWRKHCISVFSFDFCLFLFELCPTSRMTTHFIFFFSFFLFFCIISKTLFSTKQCSGKSKAVLHLYAKREKIKERQCEATFLYIFGN